MAESIKAYDELGNRLQEKGLAIAPAESGGRSD
jgi:hypothetical protein